MYIKIKRQCGEKKKGNGGKVDTWGGVLVHVRPSLATRENSLRKCHPGSAADSPRVPRYPKTFSGRCFALAGRQIEAALADVSGSDS